MELLFESLSTIRIMVVWFAILFIALVNLVFLLMFITASIRAGSFKPFSLWPIALGFATSITLGVVSFG